MDGIVLVKDSIDIKELRELATKRFGDLIKAVVDVKLGIMAVGGDMHADEETCLLEQGSLQDDLWGINIYPDLPMDKWIEFDSVINIRPRQNNHSRGVEDLQLQKKIAEIVSSLVKR